MENRHDGFYLYNLDFRSFFDLGAIYLSILSSIREKLCLKTFGVISLTWNAFNSSTGCQWGVFARKRFVFIQLSESRLAFPWLVGLQFSLRWAISWRKINTKKWTKMDSISLFVFNFYFPNILSKVNLKCQHNSNSNWINKELGKNLNQKS